MSIIKKYSAGILVTIVLAITANFISGLVPYKLISGSVFALFIRTNVNHPTLKWTKKLFLVFWSILFT